MNKLTIIGNLTREPELRTTTTGVTVCDFSVAVNRKKTQNNPDPGADYFRVTVWRERGEVCAKYLTKGSKVCVIGPVSVRTFTGNDGTTKASLEVTAEEVEFLSQKDNSAQTDYSASNVPSTSGRFTVVETDELPF